MKAQLPSAPATSWDKELFQKRFEEGYDEHDDEYLSYVIHSQFLYIMPPVVHHLLAVIYRDLNLPLLQHPQITLWVRVLSFSRPSYLANEDGYYKAWLITDSEVIENLKIQNREKQQKQEPKTKAKQKTDL